MTHIDDSPLTEEERLRGIIVKVTSGFGRESTPTETIHSIPASGIVKFGIVPEAGMTSYTINVSMRWCGGNG